METVRLGVVGLGNMGSVHARTIPKLAGAHLSAVCDVVDSKSEGYGEATRFTDAEAMLDSGLVDAVVVATPHYSHTTIGIAALERGIHLLCEKPISVHKRDCERLIGAWERSGGLVFAAMFNQRTDPHYQTIRRIVQSGELGEIQRVNWIITNWFRSASYYASGGWRATWRGEGGGVLLNQCPHNLDLLQWITGMPSRVWARGGFGKYHAIEVEDEVTAVFDYPNGATGVFVTTTGEAPGTNRLEIAGDRGKLVSEDGKITVWRTEVSVAEFRERTPDSFATPPVWRCEVPVHGGGGQHREVLENFIGAVRSGQPLVAPAQEGIRSVELANAMLLSMWTGEMIELPLDGARYEAALMEKIEGSTFEKAEVRDRVSDLAGSY
jgi:predicted dehydrogenase